MDLEVMEVRSISVLLWGFALAMGSGISGGLALAALQGEGTTEADVVGGSATGDERNPPQREVDAIQESIDQSLNRKKSYSFRAIENCLRTGRDLLGVVKDPYFAAMKTEECFTAAVAEGARRMGNSAEGLPDRVGEEGGSGSVFAETDTPASDQPHLFVADCLREGWVTLDQVGAYDSIEKTTACLMALKPPLEEQAVGGSGVVGTTPIEGSGLDSEEEPKEPKSVGTGGSPLLGDDESGQLETSAAEESFQGADKVLSNEESTPQTSGAKTVPYATQLLQRDEDVQKAFKAMLMATYLRQAQQLGEWRSVVTWTNVLGYIMFFVVHGLIIVALWAAYKEFKHALDTRRRSAPEQVPQNELRMSLEGIALKTSMHGILLVAAAFGFYFLYLRFVYPITVIKLG